MNNKENNLDRLMMMTSYDYELVKQSQKQVQEHHDKCYGRGLKHPYQYIVHDDGTVTENVFGEIKVLGKVSNPEILEEAKRTTVPAFSIRAIGQIEEHEKIHAFKAGAIIKTIMPDFYNDLHLYQQAMLDNMWEVPSRQLGKDSWLTKFLSACEEDRQHAAESIFPIMKFDTINKNGRQYSPDFVRGLKLPPPIYDEFNPYERGQRIWIISKPDWAKKQENILSMFIYENRYGGLRKDNEIPKVKLNIRRKNNARRSTKFIKKNSK